MTMLMVKLCLDKQEKRMDDHCQEEQGMMKQIDEMEKLKELLMSDVEEMVVESHCSRM
jgi:hypothetical protein